MSVSATLDRQVNKARTSGLTLAWFMPPSPATAAGTPPAVNAWLSIGSDDMVTLTLDSSGGSGDVSLAGLAQILCEDLMVDTARLRLQQGGDPTRGQVAPRVLVLNAEGRAHNPQWRLREVGAIARELLVRAAMLGLGDRNRGNYSVHNGHVTHDASDTTLTYGQLATAAARVSVPRQASRLPEDPRRADIPLQVDGSAVYGLDVRVPGMVYAVIKHCPSLGGVLAVKPALPEGALAVIPTAVCAETARGLDVEGQVNAVAVVGASTWDAMQAARRLRLEWRLPPQVASLNSVQFSAQAQDLLRGARPFVPGGGAAQGMLHTVERGPEESEGEMADSAQVLEACFALPYVPSTCMEVLNCTVDHQAGLRCELWAPTTATQAVRALVMSLTGLAQDQITVHRTFIGGGADRKAELDFIAQAVQVGMALQKPVKLMWPREEHGAHDRYRPMGRVHVRAGLDAGGAIQAWTLRTVTPSLPSKLPSSQRGVPLDGGGDRWCVEGAHDVPYQLGVRRTEWVNSRAPVPQGLRHDGGPAVNTFAVESMMDELAATAGQDPLNFRRAHLTDPGWLAVLEAVAQAADWGAVLPSGVARGVALGRAFNTLFGQVVEVSATRHGPRVERVWLALGGALGACAAQREAIEAQVLGSLVRSLNAALYGGQSFIRGAAQVRNFLPGRQLRLNDMPALHLLWVPTAAVAERGSSLGGLADGEVPTLAPALANAWFALSGKRVRSLPFFTV